MSLFGAKKQPEMPLKEVLKRAKEIFEKRMESASSEASAVSSSHIGEVLARHNNITGPLPTDPDGTATTSEIAREDLGDFLGECQLAAVTLTREQFNQGVRIDNAKVRAAGHPRQIMEPVLGTAKCDEYGNRLSQQANIHTISSNDDSSLSPPLTTSYGGSEISFPLHTPRERVQSPLLSTNYEGSLLVLPPSALPQDSLSTPRASAGLIACKYISAEEKASQHAKKEGGMEETRNVYIPILRKFEISDSSNDAMTEVEWRDKSPYIGKSANQL